MNNSSENKTDKRWGDWLSAALLILIMQIAAARLVATLWTGDLSLVQLTAFLGTILGLALGRSVFKRIWVTFFTVAYGIILIPWQLGLTLDIETNWINRLDIIGSRLGIVLQELLKRKPVTDNMLFILLMAMLFWLLTISAGVVLTREANPWKVIIPGGIAIFVIHSFDPLLVSRSWYLAFYLFFALLLVARIVYVKNTAKWRDRHTHTSPDMGFDFSRVAVVLSMVLVFFAWNVPVMAETFKPAVDIWRTTSRPWLTVKDRFSFMFASLKGSVGLVQNYYGQTLQLGLGNPLSDQVIMEVQAPTTPPNSDRYYWEARVYDTYESNQWLSTILRTKNLTPDSPDISQPGVTVRPIVTFTFFPDAPISNLYTVPEPLWINIPVTAYMTNNTDGTVDFNTLMSRNFVRPGEQYSVRSALDSVTISQLKAAGNDYPQWVLDEYLQIPSNITSRTRELAKTISTGLQTPYDITNAVTDYLRNNITYDLSIDQPPASQERIDWFLFDYKKGFCNYYASAEVILLRSIGIPARMAVGFAQGEQETPPAQQLPPGSGQDSTHQQASSMSTYIVRQKDAHAWPEVFFPGIGWVIFEPTSGQAPLSRPSGETVAPTEETKAELQRDKVIDHPELGSDRQLPSNASDPNAGKGINFWTPGNIILFVLFQFALGAILIFVWQMMRGVTPKSLLERITIEIPEVIERGLRRVGIRPPDFLVKWIYYMRLPSVSRSYLEVNHALVRVGRTPLVHDTPNDRITSLISTIPAAKAPAESILTEYQTSVYSPRPADPEVARKAGIRIRNLSWKTWFQNIIARIQGNEDSH